MALALGRVAQELGQVGLVQVAQALGQAALVRVVQELVPVALVLAMAQALPGRKHLHSRCMYYQMRSSNQSHNQMLLDTDLLSNLHHSNTCRHGL